MTSYTKAECAAIDAAWRAINRLCECTNWTDGNTWREAERVELRSVGDSAKPARTAARAMICKAWAQGLDNPDAPARDLFWIRSGYRDALFLGVRHAVERAGTDYNGPMVAEARALCTSAIEANDAHTLRIVEG